jgi:hypothetical protein
MLGLPPSRGHDRYSARLADNIKGGLRAGEGGPMGRSLLGCVCRGACRGAGGEQAEIAGGEEGGKPP